MLINENSQEKSGEKGGTVHDKGDCVGQDARIIWKEKLNNTVFLGSLPPVLFGRTK